MMMRSGVLVLILVAASACSGEGESRQRLMEKPRTEGTAAAQTAPIDLVKAATDAAEMDRICLMTHAEVTQRLGAHKVATRSRVRAALGDKEHQLEESGELVVSPKGSFSVAAGNKQGRSREVVFVNGLMAHRASGGEWTLEKGDGFEQRFREDTYRMWSVTYKTFRDHLAFSSPEPTEYEGRPAVRYAISLAKPEGNPPAEDVPPPPLTATDEERERARLARLIDERRGQIKRYLSATGELIVDEATQAPLKFVFDGQHEVIRKGPAAGGPDAPAGPQIATLVTSYHVEATVQEVGQPHVVNLPEASKPPPRRREIDSQPLEGLAKPPPPPSDAPKPGTATP